MAETRYAIHPDDYKKFDSDALRKAFLIENIFEDDHVKLVYTHYDRLIVGGIKPTTGTVQLQPFNELKAEYFLQRREIGIVNVGAPGYVMVDGTKFSLQHKDALYVGKGRSEERRVGKEC